MIILCKKRLTFDESNMSIELDSGACKSALMCPVLCHIHESIDGLFEDLVNFNP